MLAKSLREMKCDDTQDKRHNGNIIWRDLCVSPVADSKEMSDAVCMGEHCTGSRGNDMSEMVVRIRWIKNEK